MNQKSKINDERTSKNQKRMSLEDATNTTTDFNGKTIR